MPPVKKTKVAETYENHSEDENSKSDSNSCSSDDSAKNSSQSEDQIEDEEIMINFEFSDIYENDFNLVKNFMFQLFNDDTTSPLNLSALSEKIISQKGTAIRIGTEDGEENEENEIYGFMSAIDLKKEQKTSASLIKFITETKKITQEERQKIYELFNPKIVGDSLYWIICERFMNLPVNVSLPLYEFLLEEFVKEESNPQFILFIKTYSGDDNRLEYYNPEDELLCKRATKIASLPRKGSGRILVSIDKDNLVLFVNELREDIEEN